MTERRDDGPTFAPADLKIADEIKVRNAIEDYRRRAAARWVAIAILPAVAAVAVLVLGWHAWHFKEPPAWPQSALFSILTAAVASLFGRDAADK